MIELGSKVRDRISGFTGIVIGRAEYLFDTPSLVIKSQGLHEGMPIDAQWISEGSLEVLETPNQ